MIHILREKASDAAALLILIPLILMLAAADLISGGMFTDESTPMEDGYSNHLQNHSRYWNGGLHAQEMHDSEPVLLDDAAFLL